MTKSADYTVPGLGKDNGDEVAGLLQGRLHALNDLQLVLKHVHWNVVGPNFIAVHEMLDPQTETVRGFADEVAERIATLGTSPRASPANWSPSASGRTTRCTRPASRPTWRSSTRSTPESSRTTVR